MSFILLLLIVCFPSRNPLVVITERLITNTGIFEIPANSSEVSTHILLDYSPYYSQLVTIIERKYDFCKLFYLFKGFLIEQTLVVALLLCFTATAFSVQCEVPDMSVYSPQVVFTCSFSEAVSIKKLELVFVPNFVSISPMDGASEQFSITVNVVDNTKGEITLLLAEGAFTNGESVNEEYSATVACLSLDCN